MAIQLEKYYTLLNSNGFDDISLIISQTKSGTGVTDDNLKEISNVYEQSWKYAYKNIIPQSYLDSIPKGHWVESLSKGNRENMVGTENNLIVGTSSLGR